MLDKSSVFALAEGMYFWTQNPIKLQLVWTFHFSSEVAQISHVIFETRS